MIDLYYTEYLMTRESISCGLLTSISIFTGIVEIESFFEEGHTPVLNANFMMMMLRISINYNFDLIRRKIHIHAYLPIILQNLSKKNRNMVIK